MVFDSFLLSFDISPRLGALVPFRSQTLPHQLDSTLKAKIAKLKSELINGSGGKSAGSKDAGRGFDVSKSGDTRIGLVGFPSVGKSTLLTQLTGTRSAVSEIEFTTLTWYVAFCRPLLGWVELLSSTHMSPLLAVPSPSTLAPS
jgi:hypothetical protein